MISVGGVEGNRTPGLLHAEQTLSRLSYDPFIEGAVDLAGIEPANLLSAIQALSQLSYRPKLLHLHMRVVSARACGPG